MAYRKQPQPYLFGIGTLAEPEQYFLVIDCIIIGEVKVEQLPLILLAAYFVFNICYVKGCSNMFSFLEVLLCKSSLDKATASVNHFITSLHMQR